MGPIIPFDLVVIFNQTIILSFHLWHSFAKFEDLSLEVNINRKTSQPFSLILFPLSNDHPS